VALDLLRGREQVLRRRTALQGAGGCNDRTNPDSGSSSTTSSSKGKDDTKGSLVPETHVRAARALQRLWEQKASEAERRSMRRDLGSRGDRFSPVGRLGLR
jgi:hypothetical protein